MILLNDIIINVLDDKNISFFEWLNFLTTLIFSIFTIWIAFMTYKLQKKVKENEDKNVRINNINNASNIYYFLNDLVYKLSGAEFDYNIFSGITVDGKEYIKNINYLRTRCITQDEYLLLREIFYLFDTTKVDPHKNQFNFKILYKKVIDSFLIPSEMIKLRKDNKINNVCSIKILSIMLKLEREMNRNTDTNNEKITVYYDKSGNIINVKKLYFSNYFVEYDGEYINGNIQQYETVFFFNSNKINSVFEKIYEGNIKNNLYNGKGNYFYYTTKNNFGSNIDSVMLCQEGINYDEVAQMIKEQLIKNNIDISINAKFVGTFIDGKINKGTLLYKDTPLSDEKSLLL